MSHPSLSSWFDHPNITKIPVTIVRETKFYSGRNQGQILVRECLLSFGAEYFVLQFVIQEFKD
jgi:hypothetical protein